MDAVTLELMTENRNAEVKKTVLRERDRLFNFIKKSVRNIEDAKDILHDVLYQFTAGYDDIRSAEGTTSWLYTVAKNKIIDMFRRRKTVPISEIEANYNNALEGDALTIEDIVPDLSGLPDEEIYYDMLWTELEEAIDELPRKQKDVFVMHEFKNKSFKEISKITGEPLNTLLSRKRYAVLYLRERLKDLFNEI